MSTQDSKQSLGLPEERTVFQTAIEACKDFELLHLERMFKEVMTHLDPLKCPNYLQTLEAIGVLVSQINYEKTIKANGPFEVWGGAFIPTSEAVEINNPPKTIRINNQDVKVEYDAIRDRIGEMREASEASESDTTE